MRKLISIVAVALMLAGTLPANIVQAGGGGQPYVEISAPDQARTGGHDMQLAVTVNNPRDQQVWFDGYIVHDVNLEYDRMVWSNGSDLYTTESEGSHQYKYWRGLVPPYGSATFAFQAKTPQQQDVTFLRTGLFLTASGMFLASGRSIVFSNDSPLPPAPTPIPRIRQPTATDSFVPRYPEDLPIAVFGIQTIGEIQWSGSQENAERGISDAECTVVMSGNTPEGRMIVAYFTTKCITGFPDN